jgi:hypothetical protein
MGVTRPGRRQSPAAREANIYYVAHVDSIRYLGGLKPKGERVIFVSLPRGASAPRWRATSLRNGGTVATYMYYPWQRNKTVAAMPIYY